MTKLVWRAPLKNGKPCPFCGHHSAELMKLSRQLPGLPPQTAYQVTCMNDDCDALASTQPAKSAVEAGSRWNTRRDPSEVAESEMDLAGLQAEGSA